MTIKHDLVHRGLEYKQTQHTIFANPLIIAKLTKEYMVGMQPPLAS